MDLDLLREGGALLVSVVTLAFVWLRDRKTGVKDDATVRQGTAEELRGLIDILHRRIADLELQVKQEADENAVLERLYQETLRREQLLQSRLDK